MPIVHAVDGVLTLYQERQSSQRYRAPRRSRPALEEPAEEGHTSESDFAYLAAQQAYGHNTPPRPRKPAVLAHDIMSGPVITLRPDATLADAWGLMRTRGIRHVPVVSETGVMVGIMSDRDILQFSHSSGRPLPAHIAGQVMEREVLSATPSTPIQEIAGAMVNEGIGALPILDEAQHPIGIITASDILRALMNQAPLELWT